MPNQAYDDDIFTLKEDEAGKRRSHMLQYALVSLFAVLVVAVAIYASIWLTNDRVAYQGQIVQAQQAQGEAIESENTDFWPQAEFPGVPQLASTKYETRTKPGHAEINVPMAVSSRFEEYAEQLADDGAQMYIKTPRLIVLNYRGTEIHLIKTATKSAIVLCAEPPSPWNEPAYAAFPLPKAGQLVSAEQGTGENSRVLTYRQVSANDAINYVSSLVQADWMIVGTLEPVDHVFACSFKKDDMQISVDYFSAEYDCRIKLDFIR